MSEATAIQTLPLDRDLIIIQRNPTSGSGRGRREVFRLLTELRRCGYEVRVYHNRDRFNRFVNRPCVAKRLRCLVAAGGDGTLSSLVQRHPQFPIAVLPLGTENLVAQHLGVRCDGFKVARMIQEGSFLSFDTGLVGTHRFLLMASAGLDAEVVRLLAMARRGNINHFSYLKPIFHAFRLYSFPELKVVDEHGEVLAVGSHVLVSNMPEYGMKIPFCPAADPHDGLLDVRVFKKFGMLKTAWHVCRTRLALQDAVQQIVRFRAPVISLETSDSAVPLQADGDPCGTGAVTFRVAEEKMVLLVPSEFTP